MKPFKLFTLFIIFVFSSSLLLAQSKLIITSKQNIQQLKIKENGKLKSVPTWNKSGGGFLLEVKDLNNTELVSEGMAVFKLFRFDKKQSTRWIGLQEGESLTFAECFAKYPGEVEKETSVVESASKFFTSMFSGYSLTESNTLMRSSDQESSLYFSSDSRETIFKAEDLMVKWSTDAQIKNISIRDLTSPSIVWVSPMYTDTFLSYQQIEAKLMNDLEPGHNYQIKIKLDDSMGQVQDTEHSFEFKMSPLVFNQPEPVSFLIVDSVNFQWQSAQPVGFIKIIEKDSKQHVFSCANIAENTLSYATIKEKAEIPIKAKKKYQLIVKLIDEGEVTPDDQPLDDDFEKLPNVYVANFEVLLTKEEYQEFLDFMDE